LVKSAFVRAQINNLLTNKKPLGLQAGFLCLRAAHPWARVRAPFKKSVLKAVCIYIILLARFDIRAPILIGTGPVREAAFITRLSLIIVNITRSFSFLLTLTFFKFFNCACKH
jgi:hypothetical protein